MLTEVFENHFLKGLCCSSNDGMVAAAGQFRRRGERPLGGTVTPQTDPLGAGAGQTIIIFNTRGHQNKDDIIMMTGNIDKEKTPKLSLFKICPNERNSIFELRLLHGSVKLGVSEAS